MSYVIFISEALLHTYQINSHTFQKKFFKGFVLVTVAILGSYERTQSLFYTFFCGSALANHILTTSSPFPLLSFRFCTVWQQQKACIKQPEVKHNTNSLVHDLFTHSTKVFPLARRVHIGVA